VRQKDPSLKEDVEQLARGEVRDAIDNLDRQGRVHEIVGREERLGEIAREYRREPQGTLVISPDNESRRELNRLIRREMQERGDVRQDEHKLRVLDARQEMTGADRQWARQYEEVDVVRYTRGSKVLGIEPGEYARVERVDGRENRLTIERETGDHQTYDPRRLAGVAVYRESERAFSEGDRVQFTAPSQDLRVANRELGTIEKINNAGDVQVRMDSGHEVAFNIRDHPHVDHGYAVTSHSSQGQTAERVLIHVDTEKSQLLVNNRFAYVSVSRAQYDAEIYTNNRSALACDLSRDLTQRTAIGSQEPEPAALRIEPPSRESSNRPDGNKETLWRSALGKTPDTCESKTPGVPAPVRQYAKNGSTACFRGGLIPASWENCACALVRNGTVLSHVGIAFFNLELMTARPLFSLAGQSSHAKANFRRVSFPS